MANIVGSNAPVIVYSMQILTIFLCKCLLKGCVERKWVRGFIWMVVLELKLRASLLLRVLLEGICASVEWMILAGHLNRPSISTLSHQYFWNYFKRFIKNKLRIVYVIVMKLGILKYTKSGWFGFVCFGRRSVDWKGGRLARQWFEMLVLIFRVWRTIIVSCFKNCL